MRERDRATSRSVWSAATDRTIEKRLEEKGYAKAARGRHDAVPQADYVEQRVSEILDRFLPPAPGR
ncbi:MAG: hypothetical protein JRS35_20400 [Deltaproteobacteria bacterium]|nr:hypothetical protein [Deltaproteobacteria bacterium]